MSLNNAINAYIKKLNGPACIDQIFPAKFIKAHSSYASAKNFFAELGVTDQTTYDAWIASPDDKRIAQCTDFLCWSDMFEEAARSLLPQRQAIVRNGGKIAAKPLHDTPFARIVVEVNYVAM